jgi:hypothetical protein
MTPLPRLSFGVGDRFAHQAEAQLAAFEALAAEGTLVTPVWNKSHREHTFVGSEPESVRRAAAAAVAARGWTHPWFVDADHVRLDTVDRYVASCDFFTLDVADAIGRPAAPGDVAAFLARHPELTRPVEVAGVSGVLSLSPESAAAIAGTYLVAATRAGEILARLRDGKRGGAFVTEVSMDETDAPQTPPELLVILALLADAGVRPDTIAPKFTGRFNKGVDYVGDLAVFEREFSDDVAVLAHAAAAYGLPAGIKLSVHSGSDKFSLYPVIRRVLARSGAGVHVKTAGTTWLEELIGLAEAGGEGLELVRGIYAEALDHVDELCAPYAAVIDVRRDRLPSAATLAGWSGPRLAAAIRHVPDDPAFSPDIRQLLHVSFKLAAKRGPRYGELLERHRTVVARHVTENLLDRHLRPLFGAPAGERA